MRAHHGTACNIAPLKGLLKNLYHIGNGETRPRFMDLLPSDERALGKIGEAFEIARPMTGRRIIRTLPNVTQRIHAADALRFAACLFCLLLREADRPTAETGLRRKSVCGSLCLSLAIGETSCNKAPTPIVAHAGKSATPAFQRCRPASRLARTLAPAQRCEP
jgi:hypothetical protein